MTNEFKYEDYVHPEWVDYNGHMNDAEYAKVFSHAVDTFMGEIELTQDVIAEEAYTIFTLETHLCYLKEAHEGEKLSVTVQIVDHDPKRLHVIFSMFNEQQELIATSEQMLMGMDTNQGKPAPFIPNVQAKINTIWSKHEHLEQPKQVGRTIGIRKK
ncbi:thioesterase family protein [Alkalibacillus haloalkaliphilus]|uniref:thioesterase family protein n=1 Tax=Alkalibacillus haloalkaliphilus TaxID=94136 RepID=UPI002935F2CA|nr:thioesterase family protein [Alkalibacillus haloalkaliphilus]MDV2581826.1 thioesterase family protein [Alkalibacillus haloalkaliphilus]